MSYAINTPAGNWLCPDFASMAVRYGEFRAKGVPCRCGNEETADMDDGLTEDERLLLEIVDDNLAWFEEDA